MQVLCRSIARLGVISLAVLAFGAQAAPSLIGDTITVQLSIPNNAVNDTFSTVVTADSSDLITFDLGGDIRLLVDPSATGFKISHSGTSGIAVGDSSFLQFSSLNFSEGADVIGATDDPTNWTSGTNLSFTADSARLDFNGPNPPFLGFAWLLTTGSENLITLTPSAVAAIPEPSTWALSLVGGLALFGLQRRRARARG